MQPQIIESGVQLFSRINQPSSILSGINPKLFTDGGPLPNEIIEIAGDFSQDLLLDFMIRCILPQELNPEWKGTGVVFVNTDHHINILKITNVMDSLLKHSKIESRKTIIEKSLSLITILNCFNDEQLEITFKNLEKIIQDRNNVGLLLVDNITSQYWLVKQNNVKLSLDNYSKTNFQTLQRIVKNLNLVFIFSRSQLKDLTKAVDLHIDYKIIGEQSDLGQKCIVIDYVRKTSITVPFDFQPFITFL